MFTILLRPKVRNKEIRKLLADRGDLDSFKKRLLSSIRKLGIGRILKILDNVNLNVLRSPEKYTPKRVYREIQLRLNDFMLIFHYVYDNVTHAFVLLWTRKRLGRRTN